MIVNKHEYYYKKLLKSTNDNINKTIEIDDKEAILLGLESQEELSVNIISIEWENTNNIEIYEGIKPVLPNILIHWDDDTTTSIKASNNKVVLSDISYYKTQGTYTLYASFNNFTTTNSINVTVIKDELISIEWSIKADISTQQNNKANLPYIQLNYISGKINNIAYNTSSVTLNNTEYYKTIGNYELYATYKGFTTDILNVYVYNDEYEKLKNQELCFTNVNSSGSNNDIHIEFYNTNKEYSIDNRQTWFKCSGQNIYLTKNSSVYIRSINDDAEYDYPALPIKNLDGNFFGAIKVSGNILSLRYKTIFNNFDLIKELISNRENKNFDDIDINSLRLYLGFYRCFKNCDWLLNASDLYLNCESYDYFIEMFMGCVHLKYPPKLYSNILKFNNCYESMFEECRDLFSHPEYNNYDPIILPATILTNNCYKNMFKGCSDMTVTPDLPANILTNNCYESMFEGCNSLKYMAKINANILAPNCYKNMFKNCTSLQYIYELPILNLEYGCYYGMFEGCIRLVNTLDILPATILIDSCYEHMFYGCTAITKTPELPATEVKSSCYRNMFYNCNSLNYIKLLMKNYNNINNFNLIDNDNNMEFFNDLVYIIYIIQTDGIFVKNIEAQWDNNFIVPQNWTVIYYDTNENKYYIDQNKEQECDDHGNII